MVLPGDEVRSVRFPIIGPSGVVFNAVHVERMPELDRNERFAAAPDMPDIVDLLVDARAGEGGQLRLGGVQIVFDRSRFNGKSFGLALAIADRRARTAGAPNAPVMATGCIVPRGRGAVGMVEGFPDKVDAVIALAREQELPPLTFAFPEENWLRLDPEAQARLNAAGRSGKLRLIRCRTIADASVLWRTPKAKFQLSWRLAVAGVASLGCMGVLAAGGYAVYRVKPRACLAAVEALPDVDVSAKAIDEAARSCQAAADAFPNDGHLQFLLGQVRALDGSPLSEGAWRRAAELGDRDGMASYGRFLWLKRPQKSGQAIDFLSRASALGSAVAAEDMGNLWLDRGRADLAQQWFAKVKVIRAAQKED